MAKLKFGKRLKNPFNKRRNPVFDNINYDCDGGVVVGGRGIGGGYYNDDDDDDDDDCRSVSSSTKSIFSAASATSSTCGVVCCQSSNSTATDMSSLNSDIRDFGPIDSDTCQQYENKNGNGGTTHGGNAAMSMNINNSGSTSRRTRKNGGGGSGRSRSRERRSRSRERSRSRSKPQRELPKITESRSSTSSLVGSLAGAVSNQGSNLSASVEDNVDGQHPHETLPTETLSTTPVAQYEMSQHYQQQQQQHQQQQQQQQQQPSTPEKIPMDNESNNYNNNASLPSSSSPSPSSQPPSSKKNNIGGSLFRRNRSNTSQHSMPERTRSSSSSSHNRPFSSMPRTRSSNSNINYSSNGAVGASTTTTTTVTPLQPLEERPSPGASTSTSSPPPSPDEVDSPGAQTVSTLNGRDIFERSRSNMTTSRMSVFGGIGGFGISTFGLGDKKPVVGVTATTPRTSNQRSKTTRATATAAAAAAPIASTADFAVDDEENNSSSPFRSSLQQAARSASPSILGRIHQRRERSSAPSADGILEEAEELIHYEYHDQYLPDSHSDDNGSIVTDDPCGTKYDTDEGAPHAATPVRAKRGEDDDNGDGDDDDGRKPKSSPTSVLHVSDSGYAVELDPVESHAEEDGIRAHVMFPPRRRDDSPNGKPPPPLPSDRRRPPPSAASPSSVAAVAAGGKSHDFESSSSSSPSSPGPALPVAEGESQSEQQQPQQQQQQKQQNQQQKKTSQQREWTAPPKSNPRSPHSMFNEAYESLKSSAPWDPLTYTSLEDAVAAHAAMLTDDVGNNGDGGGGSAAGGRSASSSRRSDRGVPAAPADAPPSSSESDPARTSSSSPPNEGSVAGSVVMPSVASSSRVSYYGPRAGSVKTKVGGGGGGVNNNNNNAGDDPKASKEFLEQKKKTEKNEFKKVVQVKKTGQGQGGGATVSPGDATRMTSIEPQENIEIQAMSDVLGKRDDERRGRKADPPGLDATTAAHRASPAPPRGAGTTSEVQAFIQDIGAAAPEVHITSDIVVDVIQSFSFEVEADMGMQSSLSDDSCSYLSELESIDDITICDETKRMLDAHRLYENGARTNTNHPMRKSGSIMKVGSQFRKDSMSSALKRLNQSRQSKPSEGLDVAHTPSIPTDGAMEGTLKKREIPKKLTWYDDEKNWDKPFTLRTDESFDASTVTSMDKGTGLERVASYNVVDQFLGDFIKGIGKYANCGGEDDVASFDTSGQHEI